MLSLVKLAAYYKLVLAIVFGLELLSCWVSHISLHAAGDLFKCLRLMRVPFKRLSAYFFLEVRKKVNTDHCHNVNEQGICFSILISTYISITWSVYLYTRTAGQNIFGLALYAQCRSCTFSNDKQFQSVTWTCSNSRVRIQAYVIPGFKDLGRFFHI